MPVQHPSSPQRSYRVRLWHLLLTLFLACLIGLAYLQRHDIAAWIDPGYRNNNVEARISMVMADTLRTYHVERISIDTDQCVADVEYEKGMEKFSLNCGYGFPRMPGTIVMHTTKQGLRLRSSLFAGQYSDNESYQIIEKYGRLIVISLIMRENPQVKKK